MPAGASRRPRRRAHCRVQLRAVHGDAAVRAGIGVLVVGVGVDRPDADLPDPHAQRERIAYPRDDLGDQVRPAVPRPRTPYGRRWPRPSASPPSRARTAGPTRTRSWRCSPSPRLRRGRSSRGPARSSPAPLTSRRGRLHPHHDRVPGGDPHTRGPAPRRRVHVRRPRGRPPDLRPYDLGHDASRSAAGPVPSPCGGTDARRVHSITHPDPISTAAPGGSGIRGICRPRGRKRHCEDGRGVPSLGL